MHFSTFMAAAIAIAATKANPLATPTPCTTTIESFAQFDLSSVTTIFLATHTATSSVDCHGCSSLVVEEVGGPGPVRVITATVIDDDIGGTTTTTTVCSATPTTAPY